MINKYDLVKINGGIIAQVNDIISNNIIIIHPKYLCEETEELSLKQRISNPSSAERKNNIDIPNAIKFGDKDYLIDIKYIKKIYSSCVLAKNELGQEIEKAAKEIISIFKSIDKSINVSFTGSLILGTARNNFSDIDIVLTERDFDILKFNKEKLKEKLKFRSIDDWTNFYEQYNVQAGIDKVGFAKHEVNKIYQFVYNSIPVSIFVKKDTKNYLTDTFIFDTFEEIEVIGKVIYQDNYCLPGCIIINNESNNNTYLIYNLNRAYQDQCNLNDVCRVSGTMLSKSGFIVVQGNKKDFIIKIEESE